MNPQERPKRPKDGPKTAPRAARRASQATQETIKSGSGAALAPTRAKSGARQLPGGAWGPPGGGLSTLRGTIFTYFPPSGKGGPREAQEPPADENAVRNQLSKGPFGTAKPPSRLAS